MRAVRRREQEQRGCQYCNDWVKGRWVRSKYITAGCPHEKCPYHEMDDFTKYDEYLKANGDDSVAQMLKELGRDWGHKE